SSFCMFFTREKAGSEGLFESLEGLMHRPARGSRRIDAGGWLRAVALDPLEGGFDDRLGALAELALEAEAAALQLDQAACQRQAEAGAFVAAVEAALGLGEGLQHAYQILGSDADTGIADRELAAAALDDVPTHVDPAAYRREFHGVREQVDDDLLH